MRERPAILLIANWDSNVGYAWWLMESYWAAIARHRHDRNTVLIAYPSISKLPAVIEESPMTCHVANFRDRGWVSLFVQRRFIREHGIRCMYFSDRAMTDLRYLWFRLAGVRRIISHDHTPGERTVPGFFKGLVKALAARLPWINVDAALSATEFVRRRHLTVHRLPAAKCVTVQNGLPEAPPVAAADLHELLGIPRGRRVIVTTARANRYKGIDFALRCVAELVRRPGMEEVHYLFCGDGPDLENFRAEAEALGIADRVSLPGRVDGIPAILAAADIAVHPSSGEVGYSMSILEYMQAGLPVVVPDNPSVCGATRHEEDGLHYRRGDLTSAVDALGRLVVDDEMRSRMGLQARRRVEAEYSLQRAHRQLLEALDARFA